MRKNLFVFCPLLAAGFIAFIANDQHSNPVAKWEQTKRESALGCAPVDEDYKFTITGKIIPLLPGWGNHSYAISTNVDSAQLYFDQGLTMYFSYHAREAVASFREAARFDSTNAMLYWAQALSMGPSYNFGYAYKMRPTVPAVLAKMNRYAANAPQKERDLVAAMNTRYNVADTADTQRRQLNAAYAAAMKQLVKKYPDDIDIKALYTDAVMLIHAWDFWNNDGTAKSWTPELVKYCQDILNNDPQHPGGLHYYIHVTEASRNPEVALASADSLIKLFPGIAHMVHMSSHEYERIGFYKKGTVANEKADESLLLYDGLAKELALPTGVTHYYAVDAFCAMSGAMGKKAIQKALTARRSTVPTNEAFSDQHVYMFPELAMVRMGMWHDILNDTTTVDGTWTFAAILGHFAKGMAYAKTGQTVDAEKQLLLLREVKRDKALAAKFDPLSNSPLQCATVAENILLGNIRFQQKKYSEAVAALKMAMDTEDDMVYGEPKDWMLPARQYLGAFLMQMNKPAQAEIVYREDLAWNPGNGWSTVGLYNSLKAQGKTKELSKLRKRYLHSFSEADKVPNTSAY